MFNSTIVSYPERGAGGNNKWRGNCSPRLIQDIIEQYNPRKIFDPMTGSNTTGDVCRRMGINHLCLDLNPEWGGFNAIDDEIPESSDLVFWHPPYYDIVKYSGTQWGTYPDPRDLSHCPNYEDFIKKIDHIESKLLLSLRQGGRLCVLVGDIKKKGRLLSMQRDMAWIGTPEQVVIKYQYNCTSDTKMYNSNRFIPIKHEYLLIFRRDDCYVIPIKTSKNINYDIRKSEKITWKEIVLAAFHKLGGKATLNQLYEEIRSHKKCQTNSHWQEKIRQVVQTYRNDFKSVNRGEYTLAA